MFYLILTMLVGVVAGLIMKITAASWDIIH